MTNAQKISEFVEQVFDRYQINKYGYFCDFDDYTMENSIHSIFPTGEVNDEIIRAITSCIGLTKKEIINMDRQAAVKYWNKYPFFSLYNQYIKTWSWHKNYIGEMPTAEELIFKAIFSEGENIYGEPRYNIDELHARLIDTLKEIDMVVPGTYHKDANITNLQISTQIFFSFPQCVDMVRSFVDMAKRMEELFFKALQQELCEEDANELNFLASCLNATDVVMPSKVMNYDNVRTYRNAYLEENYQDFFLYVKIRKFIKSAPWRCQEFFDDMDLVREFLHIFPCAKAQMRRFVQDVTKFSCCFIWSDAKPIQYSDEDAELLAIADEMLGEQTLSDNDSAKEVTHVYIEKTLRETDGWDKFIRRLKKVTGPSSKGGIIVPDRRSVLNDLSKSVERMCRRVELANGDNQYG